MPLQIRRGTSAQKNAMTVPLADGELLWTTDDHKMYVGANNTLPINLSPVLNYSATDARETAKSLFLDRPGRPPHAGITFTYDTASNSIVATVTGGFGGSGGSSAGATITGNLLYDENTILIDPTTQTFYGNFVGSVFGDDSTLLVDGVAGVLKGNHYGDLYGNIYATTTTNGISNTSLSYNHLIKRFYGSFSGPLLTDNGVEVFNSNSGIYTGNSTGTHLGTVKGNLSSAGTILNQPVIWFDAAANDGLGSLTGNINGNATSATQVNLNYNSTFTRDPSTSQVFIPYALLNSGNVQLQSCPALKFNDNTNTLTVTNIVSNLTGNSTGYHTGDMKGSVFGDDSTVIINGITGHITGSLYGNVLTNDGSAIVDTVGNTLRGNMLVNNAVYTDTCRLGVYPNSPGTRTGSLIVYNTIADLAELITTTANTTGASIAIKTSGGTVEIPTVQSNNSVVGKVSFRSWNGYNYLESAAIDVKSVGSAPAGSTDPLASKITLSTTAIDRSTNYMTFDSDGVLTVNYVESELIGNASTASGVKVYADITARDAAGASDGTVVLVLDTGSSVPHLQFYMNGAWYNITATAA